MAYVYIVNGDVVKYPYTIEEFREENRNVSLPYAPSTEQLEEVGIFQVEHDTTQATDTQEIIGHEIILVSGVWTRTPIIVDLNEEQIAQKVLQRLIAAKAAKSLEIKQSFVVTLQGGYTYDFGGEEGEHTLDMRDTDDKTNWMLLQSKCQRMIALGYGAAPTRIKTQANNIFYTSATTALDAIDNMLSWGELVYGRKWDLDLEVGAATTIEEVEAIDTTIGWP